MIEESRGKSEYAVFAASGRMPAVVSWRTQNTTLSPNTCLPIWANTVTFWLGYGSIRWARIDTPRNSDPRIVAIHTSVVAAFFDSLRRNAGTPLEIASTPVSATAPDVKPRSSTNRLSVPPVAATVGSATAGLNGMGWMPPNQPNHDLVSPRKIIALSVRM